MLSLASVGRYALPALCLFACALAPGQSPVPAPRPDRIVVDDMVLPPEAIFGEGVWTATAWPAGNVFYEFAANISATRRDLFRKAFWEIESIANVDFFESSVAPNRIQIIQNTASNSVSYSAVGMDGGVQDLGVGANHWDDKYILVHELYHALGFLHEQSRPDRDTYVSINFGNISQTACNGNPCDNNFAKSLTATPTGAYDFESIMHYNDTAFAVNSAIPTIQARPGFTQFQNVMGNRSHLTVLDAQAMASRYGSARQPTCTSVSPNSVTAGSGGIWVEVSGTRFFEGSLDGDGVLGTRVLWDFSPLETQFINPTTVRAWVPSNLLQSVGLHSILIENDVVAGFRAPASVSFNITYPPCSTQDNEIGSGVAGVGDINGDGYADFVVGEPGYGSNARGRLRLISGYTGAVIWSVEGAGADYGFGAATASLGDVTGDGREDVVVGSPGYNNFAGRWQILNGQTGVSIATVNYGTAFGGFGESFARVGDIDGDGDTEFLVGAQAYNTGTGRVELWSVNGGLIRTHNGTNFFDSFGEGLAGGRDLGTDGVPDYVIGSSGFDGTGGSNCGRIFVYSGASGTLVATRDGDGIADNLGRSVAMIASISANGVKANIVAGASDGGGLTPSEGGTGYVRIYSGAGNTTPIFTLGYTTLATYVGEAVGDSYGWSLCDAGDVDGDGAGDFGVGAIQFGNSATGVTGPGYVHVRSGRTGEVLHKERRYQVFGAPPIGTSFGWTLAFVGDTNGDTQSRFLVGVPLSDYPCPNAGDYDVFAARIPPALGRVLITEVSSGNPDGIEIANFGTTTASLSGWTVVWKDGSTLVSTPLSGTLLPGEIALVLESTAPTPLETPANCQILRNLPNIGTTTSDFAVALRSASGVVMDEVRVASSTSGYTEGSLGGAFRGLVRNEAAGTLTSIVGNAERAWGLDSNSAADWLSFGPRSFGLENACSGSGNTDAWLPGIRVLINETDDSPDFIEIAWSGIGEIDLSGYYILASANQGSTHTRIPIPWGANLPNPGIGNRAYIVLGDTSTPPGEKPANVTYINVAANGGPGIPWTTEEYDCALYDSFGRLMDCMRTTGHNDLVAHNHPRFPSSWYSFQGAAPRAGTGDGAIGRNAQSSDTNLGANFGPKATRTMGLANSDVPGAINYDAGMDVRLNGTGLGGGLTLIINAGIDHAGERWSFTFSGGHLQGTGPIVGLGPDALDNYAILNTTPPWFGFLDERGMARLDVPPLSVPVGIDTDDIFILQDASMAVTAVSFILEFDT